MKFKAKQIAEVLGGRIDGDPEIEVSDLVKIEEGRQGTLTFFSNPKYTPQIYKTKASLCIVNEDFKPENPIKPTLIRVEDAYEAFHKLLNYYDQVKREKKGIEEPHHIADSAQYGRNIYIGAFASIGENVEIGNNVKIYPNTHIGDNAKIGDNVILYAGVKIYHEVEIGNNCVIHANAVVGSDGFGYAPDDKGVYQRVPQIGNVILEDDVDLGAGTTIDRATLGSTVIKRGVKLDNQVQIAHNVVVDEDTAMAAQAGIAGSTKIGKNCVFGGQVGLAGHIKIGNRVRLQAQSGVNSDIKDDKARQGSPSLPYRDYSKSYIHFKNLPKIEERLSQVEKKLNGNG